METLKKLPITLILLLATALIFKSLFFKDAVVDLSEYIKIGGKEYKLLSSRKDTLWLPQDTIRVPHYIPTPADTITIVVPADVDTASIIKDYYTKYYYSDIVPLDSIGTAQINDTISQNKIISRSVIFDYNIPIIKETITVREKPSNQLYIGTGLNVSNFGNINSIYTGLIFKGRHNKIYGFNLGLSTTGKISPYVGGSVYWKISLKKK